jgi:hypothetical protein
MVYEYNGECIVDYQGFGITEVFSGSLAEGIEIYLYTDLEHAYKEDHKVWITGYDIYYNGIKLENPDDYYRVIYYNKELKKFVNADIYDVEYIENLNKNDYRGNVSCLKREIVVDTPTIIKDYDGEVLTFSASDVTIVSADLVEGHRFEMIKFSETKANPGSEKSAKISQYKVYDAEGNDVTDHYELVYRTQGTLKINRFELEVKSGTAEKVYDGTELVCKDIEILSGALQEGHFIDYEDSFFTSMVDVKQHKITKEVIAIENYIELVIRDSEGNNVTKYYDIKYTFGTLKVNPKIGLD